MNDSFFRTKIQTDIFKQEQGCNLNVCVFVEYDKAPLGARVISEQDIFNLDRSNEVLVYNYSMLFQ